MADIDVEAQRTLQIHLQRLGVDVLVVHVLYVAPAASLVSFRQRFGIAHGQLLGDTTADGARPWPAVIRPSRTCSRTSSGSDSSRSVFDTCSRPC